MQIILLHNKRKGASLLCPPVEPLSSSVLALEPNAPFAFAKFYRCYRWRSNGDTHIVEKKWQGWGEKCIEGTYLHDLDISRPLLFWPEQQQQQLHLVEVQIWDRFTRCYLNRQRVDWIRVLCFWLSTWSKKTQVGDPLPLAPVREGLSGTLVDDHIFSPCLFGLVVPFVRIFVVIFRPWKLGFLLRANATKEQGAKEKKWTHQNIRMWSWREAYWIV
jgi:hypothetical protein